MASEREAKLIALVRDASFGQLVRHALARSVTEILRHDPGVRLGDDPEDVHQFRVGVRRLRSDLRTFSPALESARPRALRDELHWLGSAVGAVRDSDVLAERLRTQARALPEPDATGAQSLLSLLAGQADAACTAMLSALRSPRYVALLDALVEAANEPPIRPGYADRPGAGFAARFVRRPWRRLTDAVDGLGKDPEDSALHNVRILVKRCRYATDAVAPVAGRRAVRLAAALAEVQTVLGDLHDAVVAEGWLRDAVSGAPDGAVAAGELIVLQRTQQVELRAQWRKTWRTAHVKKLSRWI